MPANNHEPNTLKDTTPSFPLTRHQTLIIEPKCFLVSRLPRFPGQLVADGYRVRLGNASLVDNGHLDSDALAVDVATGILLAQLPPVILSVLLLALEAKIGAATGRESAVLAEAVPRVVNLELARRLGKGKGDVVVRVGGGQGALVGHVAVEEVLQLRRRGRALGRVGDGRGCEVEVYVAI